MGNKLVGAVLGVTAVTSFPLKSLTRRFFYFPPLSPQALLLNGSLPEDEQEGSFELSEHGACPEEQLVRTALDPTLPSAAPFALPCPCCTITTLMFCIQIIIRSRLDQSVEENQDLKVRV